MDSNYGTLTISAFVLHPGARDTKGNYRSKTVTLFMRRHISIDKARSCVSDFLLNNKHISPDYIKCEWVARIRIEPELETVA